MRLILTLPGLVVVLSVFTSSPSRPFLFIDEMRQEAMRIILALCGLVIVVVVVLSVHLTTHPTRLLRSVPETTTNNNVPACWTAAEITAYRDHHDPVTSSSLPSTEERKRRQYVHDETNVKEKAEKKGVPGSHGKGGHKTVSVGTVVVVARKGRDESKSPKKESTGAKRTSEGEDDRQEAANHDTLKNTDTPHVKVQTDSKESQRETHQAASLKSNEGSNRTRPENKTKAWSKVRYLIYLCDKGGSCGGWGDRQRGLVNAYLLANVTGRRFGVNMTVPCNVTHYYVPNAVNWIVSEEEIRGKPRRFIRNVGNNSFHSSLLHLDFNHAYPEDVVFLRTNVEHYWSIRSNPHYKHVLPSWAWHGRPKFFKEGWDLLMKPAPHLQALLETLLRRVGFRNRTQPFVCAHVRIGVSESNPRDTETRNDVSKLGPLWDFLGHYVSNGSQLFLATDNYHVRQMSRARFGTAHHDTGGLILHVDQQRNYHHACKGFEYALFDQLVLTRCDVLVLSNSMFSWRAALIRGKNDGLFFYHDGVVKKANLV